MDFKNLLTTILVLAPLALWAAPPETICTNAGQSFLNAATTQTVLEQGCSNTVDGLRLDITAVDPLGPTFEYMVLISTTPEGCISPTDNCCIRAVKIDGGQAILDEFLYRNKGQLKRDQRALSELCQQIITVP